MNGWVFREVNTISCSLWVFNVFMCEDAKRRIGRSNTNTLARRWVSLLEHKHLLNRNKLSETRDDTSTRLSGSRELWARKEENWVSSFFEVDLRLKCYLMQLDEAQFYIPCVCISTMLMSVIWDTSNIFYDIAKLFIFDSTASHTFCCWCWTLFLFAILWSLD